MLELFLFSVFGYYTLNLAIKRIDKSNTNDILYLNWFQDYPQQGTPYRLRFPVVTSLLVVDLIVKAMKY